ncbi:MAG: peptide chain release factor N(5)-glutamine methyltransferase [Clostridia bacterium]
MRNNEKEKMYKDIKKIKKNKVGGMALFNGLLLRSPTRETITQIENGKISIEINETKEISKKISLKSLPVIRGIYSLSKTISESIPYIVSSAEKVLNKTSNLEEEKISVGKFELICGYVIALCIILGIFTAIPNVCSLLFTADKRNLIQCVLQIIMFVIYFISIGNANILKEIFKYHGAEHKVVNAYENLKEEDITIENVRKESRFHKRCGGNFVVYLCIVICIITFIIPSSNLLIKTVLQLVLMPLFIGISYELVMIMANLPNCISFLSYPAMAIQYITTKEPSDEQIKIAIYGLLGCVKENLEMSVENYLKRYKAKNIKFVEKYLLNDALRVVCFVTETKIDYLLTNKDSYMLSFSTQIRLDELFDKMYKENIPLQYIIGKQYFFKEEYIVNSSVLIPRADSEILVESAIECINDKRLETMIDMCCGSGCIGISIANNSNIKKVFLADISKDAIDISKKNIVLNGDLENVFVLQSDLFDIFMKSDKKYDIIVSNPPYIPTNDIKTLSKEVQNEPKIALDGGKNGLDIYKKIFEQARYVLKDNGYLLLEIGYDQALDISNIVSLYKEYEVLKVKKDLSLNDRVIICRFLRM